MTQILKYELLIRFDDAGQNPVAMGRTRTVFDGGRSLPNPPTPIAVDDPTWSEWTSQLSAVSLAERDQARIERDAALASIAAKDARIAELEELLGLQSNPRHLAPFVFLGLFTAPEIFALQTSVDPLVVVGRAKLQTIITYIDLDLQETIDLVQYLEVSGVIAEGRAATILAGEPPT